MSFIKFTLFSDFFYYEYNILFICSFMFLAKNCFRILSKLPLRFLKKMESVSANSSETKILFPPKEVCGMVCFDKDKFRLSKFTNYLKLLYSGKLSNFLTFKFPQNWLIELFILKAFNNSCSKNCRELRYVKLFTI
jgi:hypothetical protein